MINIVVDANVVFAALIKDNVTRFLLFREDLNIHAPEFLFVEIENILQIYVRNPVKQEKN